MAQWCILRCRILIASFQTNLGYRSYFGPKDLAAHRIHLSVCQPTVHLFFTCEYSSTQLKEECAKLLGELLPHILLHCRLSRRPEDRSIWTWCRTDHICHTEICLHFAHLHAIYPFHGKQTARVGTLIDVRNVKNSLTFVCSAKKMFLWSMVGYGIIMAYTTFAAIYIVIKQLVSGERATIGNNVFTNMIVSTLSTVGLYFLMSFLYLDPWHMFTSSAQYFAMLPSYICTLQVYAFCNAHDVTWGTKGDNVVNKDLGAAVSAKGNIVELDMPSEQLDIDSGYDEALRNLRDRIEVPKPSVSESQQQEDYYRAVRTYMVLVWMMANAVLAMAVSGAYSGAHVSNNFYLSFILWSVAAVALFRAVGSTTFLVINVVHSISEGRTKWSMKGQSKYGSSTGSSRSGMPSWMSSGGSWVSSKLSTIAPSSMGSMRG